MDLKALSTVMMSAMARTPPPSGHSASRPSALQSSVSTSAEDLSSSPGPASTQMTSTETALDEAIRELPPFTPYSAQVPWHKGPRALFSQIFPRYGHYCGPNWSSGRDSGSLFWDKPPVDWLDYCCFCHDIGYDTHDQAKLYKADLELLECLQKIPLPNAKPQTRSAVPNQGHKYSNTWMAGLYRDIYITGLEKFLLPYRRMLLRDTEISPRNE